MTDETRAKALHDRTTRGETLTNAEQVQLQAWYDEQDQAELQQLGLSVSAADDAELQSQIAATLNQIAAATSQIQMLANENETLRCENLTLRRQLTEQPALQHA